MHAVGSGLKASRKSGAALLARASGRDAEREREREKDPFPIPTVCDVGESLSP